MRQVDAVQTRPSDMELAKETWSITMKISKVVIYGGNFKGKVMYVLDIYKQLVTQHARAMM